MSAIRVLVVEDAMIINLTSRVLEDLTGQGERYTVHAGAGIPLLEHNRQEFLKWWARWWDLYEHRADWRREGDEGGLAPSGR